MIMAELIQTARAHARSFITDTDKRPRSRGILRAIGSLSPRPWRKPSRCYFDNTGSGGTLSFGGSACMVISVIETRS